MSRGGAPGTGGSTRIPPAPWRGGEHHLGASSIPPPAASSRPFTRKFRGRGRTGGRRRGRRGNRGTGRRGTRSPPEGGRVRPRGRRTSPVRTRAPGNPSCREGASRGSGTARGAGRVTDPDLRPRPDWSPPSKIRAGSGGPSPVPSRCKGRQTGVILLLPMSNTLPWPPGSSHGHLGIRHGKSG